MRTNGDLDFFIWLLGYELRCARRYRRFVSLVLIGSGNGPVGYRRLLGETARDSDALVELEGDLAVVMGESDQDGALKAVARYKAKCQGSVDLRFAIASYPRDRQSAEVLLALARERLQRAKMSEAGAVVCEG